MEEITRNPSTEWYLNYLKGYYVVTVDGQILFGSRHKGRDPSIVFYVVPDGFLLGKKQKGFDRESAYAIFDIATEYLAKRRILYQDVVMGYGDRALFSRHKISLVNPHSAHLGLFAKEMAFEPEQGRIYEKSVTNIAIPEFMPNNYQQRIQEVYPDYDPNKGLVLIDLAGSHYRILSLNIDYFGSVGKKPDLTLWWHIWENDGDLSDHAGSKENMSMKGQSGTGKTTLTIGERIRQDDASTRELKRGRNGRITAMYLIGAEAASFAKTEGLTPSSPEYDPIMSSQNGNLVLCLNVACENVSFEIVETKRLATCIPSLDVACMEGKKAGKLVFDNYEKAGTNNGRAIISFKSLNPNWSPDTVLITSDGMSIRHFGFTLPIFRVKDPRRAAALVSACETINTGAIKGVRPGAPKISPFATDFMAGEQADVSRLYYEAYNDIGLDGHNGGIIFFVNNSGNIGAQNPYTGEIVKNKAGSVVGEKITVIDSKRLVNLVTDWGLREDEWVREPVLGLWVPTPKVLEKRGLKGFCKRFNPLRFYTGEQIILLAEQLIKSRTDFLQGLFSGQKEERELERLGVTGIWEKYKIPAPAVIEDWYRRHFGESEPIPDEERKYYSWLND